MTCGCSIITWERVQSEPSGISWTRETAEPSILVWERTCSVVADLVPFSAADGAFLTAEGYTILVKI